MKHWVILFFLFPSSNNLAQEVISSKADTLKNATKATLTDKFISTSIIGIWKDQNSILIFKRNGEYEVTFDNQINGLEGKWRVKNRKLLLSYLYYSDFNLEYNILNLEADKMVLQEYNNSDISVWVAYKVFEPAAKQYVNSENKINYDKRNMSDAEIDSFAIGLASISFFDIVQTKIIYLRKENDLIEISFPPSLTPEVHDKCLQKLNILRTLYPKYKFSFLLAGSNTSERLE